MNKKRFFPTIRVLLGFLAFVFFSLPVFAQEQITKGTIKDAITGDEVIGASVIVVGTTIGTASDIDGMFEIRAPKGAKLRISSIGYSSKEVLANGGNIFVALDEDDVLLGDVVVIGYGSVKKDDATGSVVAIKAEGMNKGLSTTPQELLSGKIAGVNVIGAGGIPGGGATIRIRGGSSLSASNDPLIVIDGLPVDNDGIKGVSNALSLINPEDIETFTVLKDASSTAIYGSRGSNGVIIITTKKGRANSKPRVSYNANVSVANPIGKLDVLSGGQYRQYITDLFRNESNSAEVVGALGSHNTDWQDEIFQTALSTDHNISLTGGFKNLPYRVSMGYTNQDGILKTSNFERYSSSINLTPSFFNKHLNVSLVAKGTLIKNRFADGEAIGAAIAFDPTQPIKDGNDKYGGFYTWETGGNFSSLASQNPVAMLELKDKTSRANIFTGSAMFDYKMHFLPELRAILNLGIDATDSKENEYVNPKSPMGYANGGNQKDNTQQKTNKLLDFYFAYDKEMAQIRSSLNLTAGYSWQHFHKKDYEYSKSIEKESTIIDKHNATENYLISFFARANYTLMNRYMLTLTARQDGSSRFSEDNRWGLFPSAALGWKVNEEAFMSDVKSISDLKLRLGWGITGQQNITDNNYPYIPSYSYSQEGAYYQFGDKFYYSARPDGYNADLKWEETTTTNIGVDYGLFRNRITGSVDYYFRKTKDLINMVDAPAGTNFRNRVLDNVGSLENQGFEFAINGKPIVSNDLVLDVGFNVARNTNKITSLSSAYDESYLISVGGIAGGTGNYIQAHKVGHAANSFYVFEQVYDRDGKPLEGVYVDQNNDGEINDKDLRIYKNPSADWVFGLSAKLTYKEIDFGFTSRANTGNYLYNNNASNRGAVAKSAVYKSGFLENLPHSALTDGFQQTQFFSDHYVQDASFIKIDNITAGYSFKNFFASKVSGRVYGTVQNPFTITKYDGLDPEVNGGIDNIVYPRPMTFIFGINLNF